MCVRERDQKEPRRGFGRPVGSGLRVSREFEFGFSPHHSDPKGLYRASNCQRALSHRHHRLPLNKRTPTLWNRLQSSPFRMPWTWPSRARACCTWPRTSIASTMTRTSSNQLRVMSPCRSTIWPRARTSSVSQWTLTHHCILIQCRRHVVRVQRQQGTHRAGDWQRDARAVLPRQGAESSRSRVARDSRRRTHLHVVYLVRDRHRWHQVPRGILTGLVGGQRTVLLWEEQRRGHWLDHGRLRRQCEDGRGRRHPRRGPDGVRRRRGRRELWRRWRHGTWRGLTRCQEQFVGRWVRDHWLYSWPILILPCSFKTDRSFVVRGSRVGVFKQKDSKLNFVTSIKNIKDPNTKEIFSPKKIMLHEADKSLLMLHPDNASSVFNMDLERGQVIEEWVRVATQNIPWSSGHLTLLQKTDGQAIQQLLPEHKFAQVTPQKTLLAVNNTGFLAIDPRLPGSKVIKSRK